MHNKENRIAFEVNESVVDMRHHFIENSRNMRSKTAQTSHPTIRIF